MMLAKLGRLTRRGNRQSRIAEKHELHSLIEDRGRIPAAVGNELGEPLFVVVIPDRAGPTIADERRLRSLRGHYETLHKRDRARLAARIASDVHDGTARSTSERLLSQTRRVVFLLV